MGAITTCLWFDGEAEEAARFWAGIFPRSEITNVQPPVVEFTLLGSPFTGLDGGPAHARTFNESVSFQVPCSDQAEVDHYWSALGDGGVESQCAWIQDRYGVWWQIVPTRLPELLGDPDAERAERALQAMYRMSKIDIAALERAADGR